MEYLITLGAIVGCLYIIHTAYRLPNSSWTKWDELRDAEKEDLAVFDKE